jgi:hypothetical protein
MIDLSPVRKMTHALSNKLMIIDGYISLMQIDKDNINEDNLQKIADSVAAATAILIEFKDSNFFDNVN